MSKRTLLLLGSTTEGREVQADLELLRSGRLLIQASSGAGKSETIKKLSTLTIPTIPNVIVDPEGEYAALRSQLPFLLVGPGGEAPALLQTVEEVTRLILKTGVSAILDLSELSPVAKKHEEAPPRLVYAQRFFETLHLAKDLWPRDQPWGGMVVTVDEAHQFAPKDKERSTAALESFALLASAGRKRGFTIVVATQRLSLLHNDVAALCENYLFGRTGLLDQARTASTLGYTGRESKEFSRTLGQVGDGDFFAYGRAFGVLEPTLFHVERVPGPTLARASSTKKRVAPPTPESLKKLLPQFEALPQEVEKKATTEKTLRDDLAAAQRRVRELEAVALKKPAVAPQNDKEIAMLKDKLDALTHEIEAIEKRVTGWKKRMTTARQLVQQLSETLTEDDVDAVVGDFVRPVEREARAMLNKVQVRSRAVADSFRQPTAASAPSAPVPPVNSDVKLRGKSMEMLRVCARMYPKGLTEAQVGSQAGIKRTGGTFGDYKSLLKTSGCIDIQGGLWFATEEGMRRAGTDIPAAPKTTEEVLAMWMPKLRGKARDILQVLVDAGGADVSYAAIGEAVDIAPSGGTFGDYLSLLRSADLITTEKGFARANADVLFL